jgi:UDP-N-acetylmuramyl pentapeptide phosphotransferase/UDP-N-acetylglucosamine-1-phosphate transferase/protein involved in polysaccharide export with SLBB domain
MGDTTNFFFLTSFFSDDSWYLFFFIFAWTVSYVSFPVIINISNEKGLLATPSERSSHVIKIPNLGGVGIFMGFVLTFTIFGSLFNIAAYYHLLGAVLVLFFLGLKDDILVLSAKSKFIVQLIVSLLLVLSSNLTISSLYGLFGIYDIDSLPAIVITTFVFVLIINSYNLIDGIDGLAGTIALCFLTVSSILLYNSNCITLFVISIILTGSIMAFLQYNFSIKKKIFMGDTGSMIVGFLISFLLVNILNLKELNLVFFSYQTNPVLLIALLFYPLLDTARIFFVRLIIFKKSPFSADKNHIHHKLLSLGFKHYQISLFVGLATLILASFSLLVVNETIYFQLFSIIFIGTLLFFTPVILHKMKSFKFNFLKDGILLFLVLLSVGFMQSCASKKDVLYFQDGNDTNIINTRIGNQKIESNDILAVKIYSLDPEASKIYNIDLLENTTNANGLDMIKLKSYLVSDQGNINMPVLGKVVVNTMTTEELEVFLTNKLIDEGHLKDPTVSVRVLNSKVTILGEVRLPGTYTFPEKNLTLLQALGLAGDLTINGERKDVLLIRQDGNNKTIYHINLTSKEWMSTELFYVKQNDVIVVNPNDARIKSSGIIGNAGTLISFVSLLLTGFLLIKN